MPTLGTKSVSRRQRLPTIRTILPQSRRRRNSSLGLSWQTRVVASYYLAILRALDPIAEVLDPLNGKGMRTLVHTSNDVIEAVADPLVTFFGIGMGLVEKFLRVQLRGESPGSTSELRQHGNTRGWVLHDQQCCPICAQL